MDGVRGGGEGDVLLSVRDVCEILQVSKPTACRYISRGQLPGVRMKGGGVHGTFGVWQSDLERKMEEWARLEEEAEG